MLFYLDPSTHTKIEEVGSANFFGITADNEFVTPLSPSILPSITKYSLLYLAEHRLGLTPIEGDVPIDNLDRFVEAGACGTAAVISPIGGIQHGDDFHVFYSETEVGPVTRKLYDELTGIQFGDIEAPEGWNCKSRLKQTKGRFLMKSKKWLLNSRSGPEHNSAISGLWKS